MLYSLYHYELFYLTYLEELSNGYLGKTIQRSQGIVQPT